MFVKDCNVSFYVNVWFRSNIARSGGTVYSEYGSLQTNGSVSIDNNIACVGVIYLTHTQAKFLGSTIISSNSGSLYIFDSRVEISGKLTCVGNNYCTEYQCVNYSKECGFQEGGAVTLVLSTVEMNGMVTIEHNNATRGGGILAVASRLYIAARFEVKRNMATVSGGGLYVYQCQLQLLGKIFIEKNAARTLGGAIHSISTSTVLFGAGEAEPTTKSRSKVSIVSNKASVGGGIALEYGSKIYAMAHHKLMIFSKNKANRGGAIYVADGTNAGACPGLAKAALDFAVECFFQWISPSTKTERKKSITINQILSFSSNLAKESGGILHGGLLDRCTISPFHKYYQKFFESYDMYSGVYFFTENGKIHDLKDISSEPLRICFCNENKPDCDYQPPTFSVKRGERFRLKLVSVDQVNHTVPATVHSTVTSGTLGEDQQKQKSHSYCSDIEFTVFSLSKRVKLFLYPEGPCNNTGVSQRKLDIIFQPCSCRTGFQPSNMKKSECECVCDLELYPYVTDCNASTDSIFRTSNFWVMYANISSDKNGYLLYPNCPYDYCHSLDEVVHINLSDPSAADNQCAAGRSGLLCGVCQSGFSLSLGSSKCLKCPPYWPALFTVTFLGIMIAGFFLVGFILMFNLTVATGTLNGLIFYANIIAANRSVFIPFGTVNFHSVFIDWMNLEFGFDVCLFDKMNEYAKVWLQIGFSFYLIIIIIVIIVVSEYSTTFARLIGRRNPVATLSTVLLLSYTKLLQCMITILSFAILTYPDGSREVVWLPDASVYYLRGNHIPLFLVSVCIILLVVLYTFFLFTWQWLVKLPNKKYLKWLWNTRIVSFVDAYHAPYTYSNRYWTGLLLLVRVFLYLVASMNVSGEPSINTLAVSITMCSLLLLICFLKKSIYKNSLTNCIELACYFHIIVLAIAKYHVLKTKRGDIALAYTSVSVSFAIFLGVIVYKILIQIKGCLPHTKYINNIRIGFKADSDIQVPFIDGTEKTLPTVTFSDVAIDNETDLKASVLQ